MSATHGRIAKPEADGSASPAAPRYGATDPLHSDKYRGASAFAMQLPGSVHQDESPLSSKFFLSELAPGALWPSFSGSSAVILRRCGFVLRHHHRPLALRRRVYQSGVLFLDVTSI